MAEEKEKLLAYQQAILRVREALLSLRGVLTTQKKSFERSRTRNGEKARTEWDRKIVRIKNGLTKLQNKEQFLWELHEHAQEAIRMLERFPDSWWQNSQTERLVRQQLVQGEKFLAGEAKRSQPFFARQELLERRALQRQRQIMREIAKRKRLERERKPPLNPKP